MPADIAADSVYDGELKPWLPARIFDCHVHISLPEHLGDITPERLRTNWAMEVEKAFPWERLRSVQRALFPDQEIHTLAFGNVYREVDIPANNEYVLAGASDPSNRARALFVTRPEYPASSVADAIEAGYAGIKPYPDLAPQQGNEVSIFDFVPHTHLEALDQTGGVLMLHLPRAGRLADPDNIRELLLLHERHPAVKVIVAHIGRAYCMPTAEKGLPHLADASGIYFDTAANLNPDVFCLALQTMGPDRILYGSDLPITLMRGMREHVGDEYINYTDGPYSWNTNRKSPEEEARYTYFLYEELRAIARAIEMAGLGGEAIEKIMYSNAARLLDQPAMELEV